ncbi:uncharacterized protein JCM15063_002488 [Sporobolomyces koalae]|uniref:uncharacterized protein n=1 Tax=Sporobolomyces koalae TaxID=500713 RepID=UPI003179660A
MSTLTHLKAAVERLTPLSLAETSWDNVGTMVEPPRPHEPQGPHRTVHICIDLTRPVVESALADPSTTAILTYHPPIFSGLKSLTLANPLQRSLLECVANGIAVYTIHTAADVAVDGTNDFMASNIISFCDTGATTWNLVRPGEGKGSRAIKEERNPPEGQQGCGMGRIVDLKEVYTPNDLPTKEKVVNAVKATLDLKHLQAAWSPTGPDEISTIAICAGSGSSVLKNVEADLYLTGEMGHHEILAANAKGIHVLCCNHTATERPWLSHFAPRLESVLNENLGEQEQYKYKVVVNEHDREPLQVV